MTVVFVSISSNVLRKSPYSLHIEGSYGGNSVIYFPYPETSYSTTKLTAASPCLPFSVNVGPTVNLTPPLAPGLVVFILHTSIIYLRFSNSNPSSRRHKRARERERGKERQAMGKVTGFNFTNHDLFFLNQMSFFFFSFRLIARYYI